MQKLTNERSDLENTLYGSRRNVAYGRQAGAQKNKEAISKLLEQGNTIVLASGRATHSVLNQANKLSLIFKGSYCIGFNGAEIFDMYEKKLLYKNPLPTDIVKDIFFRAEQNHLTAQTYNDECVLVEKDSESLKRYCARVESEYEVHPDISEYLLSKNFLASKVLVIDWDSHEHLEEFKDELFKKYPDEIDAFYSNPNYLEIVKKGTNKGAAVRKLCEILGADIKNTFAVGDAQNDLPLLEAVNTSCAVKNAVPELKERASYVTKLTNNEGAVAEFIETCILT